MTVFLDTDTQQEHTYTISILQAGQVIESEIENPPANFPFRNIVMSPTVNAGDAIVRIEEAGRQLASKTIQPQLCSSGELTATITVNDANAIIAAQCT